MDSELRVLSNIVSEFDPSLSCKRDFAGYLRVYHYTTKYVKYDLDGETMLVPYKEPYHVFSLTDTWGFKGVPRKWGTLHIENKLKELRLENREKVFRAIEEGERLAAESKERSQKNLSESMAYEARDLLKEASKDLVLHSTEKKNDKRYLNDKKLKGI